MQHMCPFRRRRGASGCNSRRYDACIGGVDFSSTLLCCFATGEDTTRPILPKAFLGDAIYLSDAMNLSRGVQGRGRASMNVFEQSEADTVWMFRRTAQVDLVWDPQASAATKQASMLLLPLPCVLRLNVSVNPRSKTAPAGGSSFRCRWVVQDRFS